MSITQPKTGNQTFHRPFFSIVIPTRNRPDLLRDALTSAMLQDFDDFEVVVSDNFNDYRTQEVLDYFRGNTRLRCIRPERLLSMPDHWEFATLQANGTYVLILTDRCLLKKHALKTIHKAIYSFDGEVSVCAWLGTPYDDVKGREYGDASIQNGKKSSMLASDHIAADFVKGYNQHPYRYSIPRGMNSCYRNEVAKSLRQRFGTLFQRISPDITSAYMLLASINEVLFIDKSLFLSQQGLSNGGDAYAKTATIYLDTLGNRDWFTRVPIKAPLLTNTIFQDYLEMQDLAGGNLSGVDVDWAVYFEMCYRELIEKSAAKMLLPHQLDSLYSEWSRALGDFDISTQIEVQRKLKGLRILKLKMRLRRFAITWLFARKLKRIVNNFRHTLWRIAGSQTPLEVAGFLSDVKNK